MSDPTWPGSDRFRDLGLSHEEPAFPSRPPEEGEEPLPDPSLEIPAFVAAGEAAPAPTAGESILPEGSAEAVAVIPSEADAAAEAVVEEGIPPEHAGGELEIPAGFGVLRGEPLGSRRAVAVVVARFNADVTTKMLAAATEELDRCGVSRSTVTVMPVPGAFELPLAAIALAKTRRFACIVALGCVIRGETSHFDFIATEAASGLQLAALETGVPVAFGVLTTDTVEQAIARIDRAADAVRTALEMADAFAKLRTAAASA